MSKTIRWAAAAAAVVVLVANLHTLHVFWDGFWPAFAGGAQFHPGTFAGRHFTAAQQKSAMINFGVVLVITGVIVLGGSRILKALGLRRGSGR